VTPAVLFVELGLVILGLAVLSRLAVRVGFSPIPLYLLAGLAFGRGGILPLVTAERFIEFGAEIGVILLLLLLGLEYAAEELTGSLRRAAPAGAVDAALNFLPGFAAGILLGWEPVAALFLGGVTYISSSGIVAKQLADLRWVGNRETPVVLSVLVIEDLVMAAYLPVMAALLQGGSLAGLTLTVLSALAAVAAILFIAVRFSDHISRVVFSHSDESMLLSILGLTLVVAGLAERVHVSAAVGAFLVGIALSGDAADRARGLLTPLRDLFAAAFFVFFGLRIDPASIPSAAGAAVALGAVTVATKLLTGWWSARRVGVGSRGRWRAGALLVARGEFSLVIAGLAVAAGIEPDLGPVATAYVLLMAVIGPVAVRLVGRGHRIPREPEAPRPDRPVE
jgi:CPA2 family monovalent cation:H+ antiporter-2